MTDLVTMTQEALIVPEVPMETFESDDKNFNMSIHNFTNFSW